MPLRALVSMGIHRGILLSLSALIGCVGCRGSVSPPPTNDLVVPSISSEAAAPRPTPVNAFTKQSEDGRFVVDPGTGIILDTKTDRKWLVGPDQDMDYAAAEEWIESLVRAGGPWRMPRRDELLALHEFGKGTRHIDPVFEHGGWWVWAEPRDEVTAWFINFASGRAFWASRLPWQNRRVFAISPLPEE